MKTTGSILFSVLKELGIEDKVRLDSLQSQWKTIFQEPLSLHTYPADLKGGELLINVDSPAWMQQLKFFKQDIVSKLHPFSVKTVKFRNGRVYHKAGERERNQRRPSKNPRPLTDAEKDWINHITAEIEDADLKESFRKTLEKALTRKGDRSSMMGNR